MLLNQLKEYHYVGLSNTMTFLMFLQSLTDRDRYMVIVVNGTTVFAGLNTDVNDLLVKTFKAYRVTELDMNYVDIDNQQRISFILTLKEPIDFK